MGSRVRVPYAPPARIIFLIRAFFITYPPPLQPHQPSPYIQTSSSSIRLYQRQPIKHSANRLLSFKVSCQAYIQESKKHLHSNILYIYKYTVFIQRYTKQSIFILFNQSFCTYRFTKNKGYSLPFKKKQIQIVTYSFSDHLFSTKVHKTQKYSI